MLSSLQTQFPDISFQPDYDLAQQTYFKIGGPAEVYVELDDKKQVAELVKYCHQQDIKLTILGGLSNVIVSDDGIKGLVAKLTNDQVEDLHQQIGNKHLVLAGAGARTASVVRKTIDYGYTGLEYFLGVPGNLGGAIYNNAHYLQDLIGEHVHRVEVIDHNGQSEWLTQTQCQFGYDKSRFHTTKEIIWQVEFALRKGDQQRSDQLIKEATEYRAKTQPLGKPSSGCIFQNPLNTEQLKEKFPQFKDRKFIPAGFLIDQAGLKGKKIGDIEVSHKHAAFFINNGQGTADQLLQLVDEVKEEVKEKFGVKLQEEVFYLS